MSAYFELAEMVMGMANLEVMIHSQIVQAQIRSFISEHQKELKLLGTINTLIQTAFNDKVIQSQIDQLGLITQKVFTMILNNMTDLSGISDNITNQHKIKNPTREPSWMDISLLSINTAATVGKAIKFIYTQHQNKFIQFKKPINQFAVDLRSGSLRQTLNKFNIKNGDKLIPNTNKKVEISNQKIELLLANQQQIMRNSYKNKDFDNIKYDIKQYFKQHTFLAIMNSIMTVVRILSFAASIYSFIQGVKNLDQLYEDYAKLKEKIGPGGKIERDQLTLIQVVSLITANATNALYAAYALIWDIRNCYQLLALTNPDKHNQYLVTAKKYDADHFVNDFNFQFISKIQKRSVDIYNDYVQTYSDYQKEKTKDKNKARQILKNCLERMKENLLLIEPEAPNIPKYSKVIKDLATQIHSISVKASVSLKRDANAVAKQKTFLRKVQEQFSKRVKGDTKVNKKDDKKRIKRILRQYTDIVINSNGQVISQDLIDDMFEQLVFKQEYSPQYNKCYDKILLQDKYAFINVANYIVPFLDGDDFYGDHASGKQLFKMNIPYEQNQHNKSAIQLELNELMDIPNLLLLFDKYPGQEPNPKAEQDGTMMTIDQFQSSLLKKFPTFSQKKFVWLKRCRIINNTQGKTLLVPKEDAEGKIVYQYKQVTYIRFSRALAFKQEGTQKIQFFVDKSQNYRNPQWIVANQDNLLDLLKVKK